jgi:hypothetical protein
MTSSTKKRTTTLTSESDEITKMFDDIRPEDFFRETSAVQTVRVPGRVRQLGLDKSNVGFEKFIRDQLTQCRIDAHQSQEFFTPRAVLANSDEWRIFHGEDDEVPADFAQRLKREAAQMNAHWSFVAMVSPARAILPGQTEPPPIDPDDADAVFNALQDGALQYGVCWTAGNVTNGPLEYRGGIIYLDDDGKPGNEVEGAMDENMEDPFTEVLTQGT